MHVCMCVRERIFPLVMQHDWNVERSCASIRKHTYRNMEYVCMYVCARAVMGKLPYKFPNVCVCMCLCRDALYILNMDLELVEGGVLYWNASQSSINNCIQDKTAARSVSHTDLLWHGMCVCVYMCYVCVCICVYMCYVCVCICVCMCVCMYVCGCVV